MWKLLRNKNIKVNEIFLNYSIDGEFFDNIMNEGYSEADVLDLLKLFPV